jgi:phospholipid/cholesterol/gamma-HCH transport system substrate-binding protein
MKNSFETKLGIFAVLVVLAAWAIVETLGGVEMFHGGYHLNALFNTAQELKVGDSVKMAGVEIGRVEQIALAGNENKVKVTMKLHPDAVVKTDSKAVIKFSGLMGQNFVSIDFGSSIAPVAGDGAVLETGEQPDLNAIMARLDSAATGIQNLTKDFTPDTINNLLGPVTDVFKQNSGHISGAISNIENISAQISSGQGTVGRLIYEDTLYTSALTTVSNLQDTAGSARDVLATAKSVINDVAAGKGTIGKLVTDDTLYNSTTASMTNLNQILQRINQGQGTIGKLVNDQEFYKNAKLSLQKLDKAADGLEDQGPLSVLGIMANNLF